MMKELNSKKPLGAGKVPSWAIIDGKSIIKPHFNFVLNQSISNLVFSDDMKNAIVTPKKDSILDPKNYRPVLITTTF